MNYYVKKYILIGTQETLLKTEKNICKFHAYEDGNEFLIIRERFVKSIKKKEKKNICNYDFISLFCGEKTFAF